MSQPTMERGPAKVSRALSAAVLAGGKSARMGQDKALISIVPGDATLLERVLDVLAPISDDRLIIASNRPEYAGRGARLVGDRFPGTGVIGGIATALAVSAHERCLVVSCDHPFLSASLLDAMAQDDGEWDVLIPVLPGQSRQGGTTVRQTLHAVYRKSCLPAIEAAIARGDFQVISFFPDVRVRELDAAFCRGFDANLRSFFSVNTPDALATARAWAMDAGSAADEP